MSSPYRRMRPLVGATSLVSKLNSVVLPAPFGPIMLCSVPPLTYPCVDPRFHLVSPKGIAPNWNDLGNGRWATSSTYATSILSRYSEALAFR
jgi:hypothetical protein